MLNNISGLYNRTLDQGLSIFYRGPFVDQLTSDIIQFSEKALVTEQGDININRKVSYLLVECFQNVIKHGTNGGSDDDSGENEGLFCLRNFDGFYIINSINRLRNDQVETIKAMVDKVNEMDEKDLKKMYIDRLVNNEISERGGAGLGLIELARKSGQKLIYRFEKADKHYSLFHQQVSLAPDIGERMIPDLITETNDAYLDMISRRRMLQYNGDFSQRTLLPILKIVETTCTDSRQVGRARKVGHAVVEVMQNISKHAIKQNEGSTGVFIIGKENGRIFIEAGNSIHISEKKFLSEKLYYLSTLDVPGLQELHRKAIKSSIRFENKQRSGLGLIEIARISLDKIKYAFEDTGKDRTFFSMQVSL
jgi:hypothetical protein